MLVQTRPDHAAIKCHRNSHLDRKFYINLVFGGKNLIREFSDKGKNVKSLNKLLKKL